MIRVLHVDDNDTDLELISIHLRRMSADIELVQTQDPHKALDLAEDLSVECIVSDYQMPQMNGLELLAHLRRLGHHQPFVLLTGQGSEAIAAEALRSGADEYFTKEAGFAHYQRFVHSIHRLVETYRLRREQEIAARALRESEERFRIAFRTSPDSININRLRDGLYIDINEGFTVITGYSREDVIGRSSLEINIWADPADRQILIERLKRDGHMENLEARFRMKDGRVLTGLMSARVIMLEGEPHILSVTRNIDDRARVRDETRLAENLLLDMLLNDNQNLIFVRDRHLRYTLVNRSFSALFGKSPDEMIGQRLTPLPGSTRSIEEAAEQDRMILSGAEPLVRFDLRIAPDPMRERWYYIVKRPMRAPDGSISHVLGVAIDVTERKKIEEELRLHRDELAATSALLEDSNRQLESFAFTVSHDLQAPLRRIEQFSALIAEKLAGAADAELLQYHERIGQNCRSMRGLIESLLGFSRGLGGEVNRETVDLSALARVIAEDLGETAPDRIVRVGIQDGLTALADPRLMEIVLRNLLQNAWKFTADCAEARIEFGAYRDEEGRSGWFVRDNGIGFDPAEAERIFDMFHRLHAADEFPGCGIGLATVRRIIRRHGGGIDARPLPDGGAEFRFTLP